MITSMGSGLQEEEAGVVTVSLLVTEVSLLWLFVAFWLFGIFLKWQLGAIWQP